MPGTTTIKSGDVIKVNSVTPAENGTGYIVVQIKKGMILKKVIIDVAAQITAVTLDEAEDNTTVLSQLDGKTADVTLQRTLVANYWNTLAVPFNVDATKLAVLGVTVKELTGSTFADGTLTLNFADATSIVAGKPYLVKVTSDFDFSALALPNVEVSKELNTVETDAVDFIPTLGKTAIPEGDTKTVLFLAAGNTLKNPSSLPADIKGFRAYFQLKGDAAAARTFALNLGDGEATGIIATDYTDYTDKAGATFDLQGRKVQNATKKGVYIVNGKKVIKKSKEDKTMTKKEYLKPAMQVVKIQQHAQILAGSVMNIVTPNLEDELGLPPGGLPGLPGLPGVPWDEAM